MGADGHIAIAKMVDIEKVVNSEEFCLLCRNIPAMYTDRLGGEVYVHIYYDYNYYEDMDSVGFAETHNIPEELLGRFSDVFKTHWEVWT
jgi:hypothetical protein